MKRLEPEGRGPLGKAKKTGAAILRICFFSDEKEIDMANTLSDPKLDAEWTRHFEDMIKSGTEPAAAAESMLRIAALTAENVMGPRKTAAALTAAAMFFVQRHAAKAAASENQQSCASSELTH
jgi:hypothetical protein